MSIPSTPVQPVTTPGNRIAQFLRNYYIYFVFVAVILGLSAANLDSYGLFERGNFLYKKNIINILRAHHRHGHQRQ